MDDQQLRTEAGNSLLGVSLALGVMMDGLQSRVALSLLDDESAAALNAAMADLSRAGHTLAELAMWIRGR